MTRSPVSVVVIAGGAQDDLRACLETLRESLQVGDEVLLATPRHRAALHGVIAPVRSLVTVDLGVGGSVAECRERAVARARHEIVVLLDGDTVLSAHWLDPIVAALLDPGVVAAGPRCHLSLGPQAVDLPAAARKNVPAFKRHAREWRADHRGVRRAVDRLGPVCVAVRRDALLRAGGPGADLPYHRLRELGDVVLVDESLVAHVGSTACALNEPSDEQTEPLLSVCMIVKDEEEVLATAIRSVVDLADEVVVYDTGSTDRTREIADDLGARVVRGFWDDHFGDARNRALAECRGRWVLIVDADDVVEADPSDLRATLEASTAEGYVVTVQNSFGLRSSRTDEIRSCRLFRRSFGVYSGRLHEQVVSRVTGAIIAGTRFAGLVVRHTGYRQGPMLERNKQHRNLELAIRAAADAEGGVAGGPARASFDLARSLFAAGQPADALVEIEDMLAGPASGYFARRGLILAVKVAIVVGDHQAAERHLTRLRSEVSDPIVVECLRAELLAARGDHAVALAVIVELPEEVVDDDGMTVGRSTLGELELDLLLRADRFDSAADRLVVLARAGVLPVALSAALDILDRAERPYGALAEVGPDTRAELLLQAAALPVARADALLEALWTAEGAGAVLALAARRATELSLLRALEWSARLRANDLAAHCPLLAIARDGRRDVTDRVMAAAIALETFQDPDAFAAFAAALPAVPECLEVSVLEQLEVLAPELARQVRVSAD